MGRTTTTPNPQQLSRFSIGEIQDFSGVPEFYNAGTSKWLRSGTSTVSSNLTASTKANLAAAGTAAAETVLAQSAVSSSVNGAGWVVSMPIQRISSSGVSVVPAYYTGSYDVGVGVITSAGIQTVATGQISACTNNATTGVNVAVASNNTKIFAYTPDSGTTFSVYSTTNGTTWTAEAVTGLPNFDYMDSQNAAAWASSVSTINYTAALTYGWRRTQGTRRQFAAFWCGARFLLIGFDNTNYIATLSTNGYDFGGDNTTAVIGSNQPRGGSIQFYRNGNNCYLNVGGEYRYSTDGGVTWAACTFAAAPNPNAYAMQYNQTDPAKLVICYGGSTTTAYYSSDSGQTWSANRPLPLTYNFCLYYRGSTLVVTNGSNSTRVSTDDGVTWTTSVFPVGVLGTATVVFADANRWYCGIYGQSQLLTSSDGVSWTIRTLPQEFWLPAASDEYSGIVSFDSNTVLLLGYNGASGYNQGLFTLDGGVTWTGCQFTTTNTGSSWGVGNAFVTPDGGGVGFAFSHNGLTTANNTNILKSDLVAGGAYYRTGPTAITPERTNAFAYVRVE